MYKYKVVQVSVVVGYRDGFSGLMFRKRYHRNNTFADHAQNSKQHSETIAFSLNQIFNC